jgi:hypothetical protein
MAKQFSPIMPFSVASMMASEGWVMGAWRVDAEGWGVSAWYGDGRRLKR